MMVAFSIPGSSLLHRHDPRAKLAGLVAVLPAFVIRLAPWVPLAYAAALGILILVSLGPRELRRSLTAIAPILLIIFVLTPLFRRGGDLLWSPFGLPVLTSEGLTESVRLVGRFAGLTFAFYAVFRTLELEELVLALRWYGLPYSPALTLIMAFRFIPTLVELYQNVQDAHSLRTAGDRPTGFFGRILPQLTSVFIQAIRMVPALAMALETRGLGRRAPRTEWRKLPRRSTASWLATAAVACLVWIPAATGLLS
jgi:energy-coupling factor transport system permease protein